MAAGGVDGHRLVHGAGAALHLAGVGLAAAQQVEHVGGPRALGAEALHHVHHRGVAVAQRPVGVRRAARQLDRRREQHGVQLLEVPIAGREPQLGGRGVRLGAGEQVVVHLHDDPGAAGELDAVAGLADRLLAAGRPRPDPRGVVDLLEGVEAGAAEAGPALAVLLRVLLLGGGDLLRGHLEQDHVVDDLGVARLHGRAGQPGVALETGVEQEAAVVVGARAVRRGGGVRRRHRQGLAALALAQRHLRGRLGGRVVVVARVRRLARSTARWRPRRRCRWPRGRPGARRRCSSSPPGRGRRRRPAAASRVLIRGATGASARRARAGGRGRRSARRRRRC